MTSYSGRRADRQAFCFLGYLGSTIDSEARRLSFDIAVSFGEGICM